MMMSEFIERTKFEPTCEEYDTIEQEYYDFPGDKDAFCRKWLRDGGIQRLSRERVKKIYALQQELIKLQQSYNALDKWANDREAHLCQLLNTARQEKRDALDRLNVIRSIAG